MPARSPSKMLREERRRAILQILEREQRVTVQDLVQRFGVTAVTIRADLDSLARMGALERSHGGAVTRWDRLMDFPITIKEGLHHAEKVRIARAAVELVRPEQTILLDSGTTTAQIARLLKGRYSKLTVITNALNIAYELASAQDITVVMLGGLLRPASFSMVGPQAEHALGGLAADHLFLGVDGIDPSAGLFTPDILEAKLNAIMVKVSREVTVVADSSKFGRRGLSLISEIDSINRLITDRAAPEESVEQLRSAGVEVMLV